MCGVHSLEIAECDRPLQQCPSLRSSFSRASLAMRALHLGCKRDVTAGLLVIFALTSMLFFCRLRFKYGCCSLLELSSPTASWTSGPKARAETLPVRLHDWCISEEWIGRVHGQHSSRPKCFCQSRSRISRMQNVCSAALSEHIAASRPA